MCSYPQVRTRLIPEYSIERLYEGLLDSEGKSLLEEVERQDSRIQREITAADMERK